MDVLHVLRVDGVSVGKRFVIELARTPEEWVKGLSGRTELSGGHGLFFVYQTSEPRSFWMKGMLFPIDIIYIDELSKVVHVEKDVPPIRPNDESKLYSSRVPIKYALEVNAGESSDIITGNSCELNFNNDISRYILTFI